MADFTGFADVTGFPDVTGVADVVGVAWSDDASLVCVLTDVETQII